MSNDKISNRQMIFMLTIFRVTMSLSYFGSMDFPPSNQDNWIIILLSFLYAIFFAIPILFLVNKFKGLNMIEYFSIILGKKGGKIINLVYGIYFLAYSIYLIGIEAQLAGVNLLPSISNMVIIGLLLIVSLYILSKGIVLMFWSGEMISSLAFIGIILLVIAGLKNVDINLLRPILKDSTLMEINKGTFLTSLIFTDIFLLSMGAKYLTDKKSINKVFIKSVIYSLLFVTTINIVIQASLGVEQSKNLIYPFLIYSRLIKYSSVFERIDILYVITWLSAHTGKVAIYLFFSLMCFKDVFNIKKGRALVIILTIIVGVVSINLTNKELLGVNEFFLKNVLYIPFIFSTIIPTLICIVYFFRRKTLKKYTIEEKQL